MVEVKLSGQDVTFKVLGLHKLLAMKGSLRVPLSHIVGVAPATWGDALAWDKESKVSGSLHAATSAIGTFKRGHQMFFVDVSDVANSIAVELREEEFHKLIIQVKDPKSAIAKLQKVVLDGERTVAPDGKAAVKG